MRPPRYFKQRPTRTLVAVELIAMPDPRPIVPGAAHQIMGIERYVKLGARGHITQDTAKVKGPEDLIIVRFSKPPKHQFWLYRKHVRVRI